MHPSDASLGISINELYSGKKGNLTKCCVQVTVIIFINQFHNAYGSLAFIAEVFIPSVLFPFYIEKYSQSACDKVFT